MFVCFKMNYHKFKKARVMLLQPWAKRWMQRGKIPLKVDDQFCRRRRFCEETDEIIFGGRWVGKILRSSAEDILLKKVKITNYGLLSPKRKKISTNIHGYLSFLLFFCEMKKLLPTVRSEFVSSRERNNYFLEYFMIFLVDVYFYSFFSYVEINNLIK